MFTIQGRTGEWEIVIGLETHIEIMSNSKLFSGASADYNPTIIPNTQVSMIDVAMPGMLPVLNEYCVEQVIKMGLGLNAQISKFSRFARKQYFYPDLPQGYQISQPAEETPIVGRGWIEIIGEDGNLKKIFIERAHLEQDAGKLRHDAHPTKSFADYNRAGVGLLEIVTFLDIKNPKNNSYISSPNEAERYLRKIREMARALGVSHANMEEGSMRADVNVSIKRKGSDEFGTRAEIKNMVSFRFIKSAIEFEARRQIEIIENGGVVSQDTMRYNQTDGTTSVMRSKQDALDYRYFLDPDLLPVIISQETIDRIKSGMPELPEATRKRYTIDFGLSDYDTERLTESTGISRWFESAVDRTPSRAKPIANWMTSELFAHPQNWKTDDDTTQRDESIRIITPSDLSEIVDMIASNDINGKMAKDIFIKMLDNESGSPREIADKHGLKQMSDTGAIEKIIDDVIAKNPAQLEQYKSGKTGLLGFFVGQVMRATAGSANPATVNDMLNEKLNK